MKTICLNMIVKNESKVIERCLLSVKNIINYWVIVDTGSTDGTQDVVKKFFNDVPGELHSREWIDFAHNRNEAMRLAKGKGDYLLFIDADDRLVFSEEFALPELIDDIYLITQRETNGSTYREHALLSLVKNQGEFEWAGKIHEYLRSTTARQKSISTLQNVFNEYINDGNRSKDIKKCQKDISILKQAIKDDPAESRNVFYLARTYYSIELLEEAAQEFQKRAEMGGDPMEVYYSLLYIAIIQRRMHYMPTIFINSFCKAHLFRPSRAEAIYEAARYYAENENYFLGYLLAKTALSIPKTSDNLFVESWVQDWGINLYLFICANQMNSTLEEAARALRKIVDNPRLPENVYKRFELDKWKECYKEFLT